MPHARTTIDDLGHGVFRKVRQALGVTAFGVNAMVLPPGTEWFRHFHDAQDELYFVHRGVAGFEVASATKRMRAPSGMSGPPSRFG